MKTSRPENGSTQTIQLANTQNRQHYLFTPFAKSISLLLFAAAIILSCFTATPPQAKAQEKEHKPCLVLYEEMHQIALKNKWRATYGDEKKYDKTDTTFFYNPYKIMIDTCSNFSASGQNIWATHYFDVEFEYNIIPRKEIYEDGRLVYYAIDDILDKYKESKEGFREFEKKFGKFKFVDRATNVPDTGYYEEKEGSVEYKRKLSIQFENYVCAERYDNVGKELFEAIDAIKFTGTPYFDDGLRGTYFLTSIVETSPLYDYLEVYPNITDDEITITLPIGYTIIPKEITIINTSGKTMKTLYTGVATEQDINVHDLPNGQYIIKVGNFINKFIIAR